MPPLSEILRNKTIGFFTSVTGYGGSEVIFADVMESVAMSGAHVVCWSERQAAIRQITAQRDLRVEFRDWPREQVDSPASTEQTQPATKPRVNLRSLWRTLAPAGLRRFTGFFGEARGFEKELATVNPDLILINSNGYEAAALAGRRWNKEKTLLLFNLSVSPFRGGRVARWADRLMKIITMHSSRLAIHVSGAARDQWNRLTWFPESRSKVIYNGVDDIAGPAALTRKELGVTEDCFVFCLASRLDRIKGIEQVLEAVRLSPDEFRNARVLLCGTGPLAESVRDACSKPPLHGIVEMLGFRSDVKEIMKISNCLVLSSIESENFSLAALEAFMLSKPVISTRVGGMAESVIDGETGLLVPPASAAALRDAMLRFMRDPERAVQMGRNGREMAIQRFTRTQMMTEYRDLLAQSLLPNAKSTQ
jgi:glycosyltransferase involved in cell wall biosynthesis